MPWLINFQDVLIIIITILFAEQKSNWIVAMQIKKNTTKEYIVIIIACTLCSETDKTVTYRVDFVYNY